MKLFLITILLLGTTTFANSQPVEPKLVDGIGGLFIYADNSKTLSQWYKENLGIEFQTDGAGNYFVEFGQNERKFTVFAIFPTKEKRTGNQFILNLRLNNIGATIRRLQEKGTKIDRQEDFPYGTFAWFSDSEGNKIEVWQPK